MNSLKVINILMVTDMAGNEVATATQCDTVINPNPVDPTATPMLAQVVVERLSQGNMETVKERLIELAQATGRLM